jgi:hypothetical protein
VRAHSLVAVPALLLAACAASPRAPESWCMQRAVDALSLEGVSDPRRHCLASAAIAIRCGAGSAFAAGYAKEIADIFGPGDASAADLSANAAGRECAQRSADQQALAACCGQAGY